MISLQVKNTETHDILLTYFLSYCWCVIFFAKRTARIPLLYLMHYCDCIDIFMLTRSNNQFRKYESWVFNSNKIVFDEKAVTRHVKLVQVGQNKMVKIRICGFGIGCLIRWATYYFPFITFFFQVNIHFKWQKMDWFRNFGHLTVYYSLNLKIRGLLQAHRMILRKH